MRLKDTAGRADGLCEVDDCRTTVVDDCSTTGLVDGAGVVVVGGGLVTATVADGMLDLYARCTVEEEVEF